MMPSYAEVFARTVISLDPYAEEIVYIGGWVHALYLAEANAAERPVYTTDIDVALPHRLRAGDRPALLELVEAAGYTVQSLANESGLFEIFHTGPGLAEIDLDLFTSAASPREVVWIEGQSGLAVQGFPDQRILLENTRWMEVGTRIHPLLHPPRRIRVPTLPAYILVKGLSSSTRRSPGKQAKDLVYLMEIARHPRLGANTLREMPEIAARYPDEYRAWRAHLHRASGDVLLLGEVADQLLEAGRSLAPREDGVRSAVAHLRRLLGETPEARE